jgi:Holliday junction resolvase
MGRASRTKGKLGELEVVRLLRAHGWPNARRTSDGRRQGSCDIAEGPEACVIEIRRREAVNVPKGMREVSERTSFTELPVLVHRPSRSPWLATLPLEELLDLLALRERG